MWLALKKLATIYVCVCLCLCVCVCVVVVVVVVVACLFLSFPSSNKCTEMISFNFFNIDLCLFVLSVPS